jgi:hypothetical protein
MACAEHADDSAGRNSEVGAQACEVLAQLPWPSPSARPLRLQDLEARHEVCARHAQFLATLGGLWLEEGEPGKAMLWLERALMLDPSLLGARADYALALADLGEPAARDQLLKDWRLRQDVPPALMRRLAAKSGAPAATAAQGISRNYPPRWYTRTELALRQGHESNLDHSPVLDSLTLTSPDGLIELPLAVPIRPRAGSATSGDFSYRLAHDNGAGRLWQVGVAAAARQATDQPATNWQSLQVSGDYWMDFQSWRLDLQAAASLAAGALNEPYHAARVGIGAERDTRGCIQRVEAAQEQRRQQTSHYLDGNVWSLALALQCRLDDRSDWRIGFEARASYDAPAQPGRPGNGQRQSTATVRLQGVLGKAKLDSSIRLLQAKDNDGYSPLLEDNARRTFTQWQWQGELAYPISKLGTKDLDGVLQLDATRQRSNLVIFEHQGTAAYVGMRLRW